MVLAPLAPEPGEAWLVLDGRGHRKGNVAAQSRRCHARTPQGRFSGARASGVHEAGNQAKTT